MKRMISWILTLVLVLSLFAGCGANTNNAEPTTAPTAAPTEAVVAADENLANAIAYLKAFYKEVKDGDLTPADYERLGTVRVGTTAYEVVYTVDCAETVVKVVKGDGSLVTMDVNEESDVEVPYVLTATITGTDGNTASLSWNHVVPAVMNSDEIVDAAYALEEGDALGYESTLTGEIISVDTPYSADYKNITVTIKVEGREDKPIMCYRLKGEGADTLMVGDVITVTGTLKNYKGTIEFDAGCLLENVTKGENSIEIPTDPNEILKAAFELDYGEYLPYSVTLTGKIIAIGSRYSEKYNNITVTIKTGEPWYNVKCFRLKGEGVDKIWLADEITVTGNITNYNGTIEFDAGSQLVSWIDNPDPVAPSDPAEIIDAAYTTLSHRDTLPYPCSLTGTITKIVTGWSDKYGNITVNMVVSGSEDQPIQCYRLSGEGAKDLAVGDTITVYGWLMNYNGTIEFDQGCTLTNVVKGEAPEVVVPATLAEQLAEAAELTSGYLGYTSTITGTIVGEVSFNSKYSSYSFNVTNGTDTVYCYSQNAYGFTPETGDTVTVTGNLTAYKGTPQFDYKATLTLVSKGEGDSSVEPEAPTVDANSSLADIVAAVKNGAELDFNYTVTGTVIAVYTNDDGTKNVPITTSAGQINCNFIPNNGPDWEALEKGDTISVTGKVILKNGKVRVDGGTLVARTPGATEEEPTEPETPVLSTPAEIVAAAFALASGETLEGGPFTLTGTVSEITGAYDANYGNVTLLLTVEGKSIQCKYLGGTGADTVAAGDTISVSGNLQNYNGTVQIYRGSIVG